MIDVPGSEAYVKFKSNSAVTAKGFSMFMETNYDEGEIVDHVLVYYLKFNNICLSMHWAVNISCINYQNV